MSEQREIIAPASIPQKLFIESDADITIASGSAGSSKSYSILLRFLRYVNDPNTRGIIFRRQNGQLTSQGGLWEEAQKLYRKIDPNLKVKIKDMLIVFSNGCSLKFQHYENEAAKEKFKGLQADFIAFDELTEFTEEMFDYLSSRNRNAYVKHKPTICAATNPDYDSFVRERIWWWLDPETGIPDPDKRGIVRYFRRDDTGNFLWYDTREEAEAIWGKGEKNGVKSMTVIGSTCRDNPYIPDKYISDLLNLSPVERARLLYGSWTARAEAAGQFKLHWLEAVKYADGRAAQRVRAWDLAYSIPSEVNRYPDWTVGVMMSKNKEKYYTVEDVVKFQDRHGGVARRILEQAYQDGKDVAVCLPLEIGGGAGYVKDIARVLGEHGFRVKYEKPIGNKMARFAPFATVAEAGFIRYVEAEWNKEYFSILESFDGSRGKKDDECDATSDAFNCLRKELSLPKFSIGSITANNPFTR